MTMQMEPTLPILMQKGTLKFAVQFHSWNKLPDQVHLTSVKMNKAVLIVHMPNRWTQCIYWYTNSHKAHFVRNTFPCITVKIFLDSH